MKYIKAEYGTEYCGTDTEDYIIVPDEMAHNDICEMVAEIAMEHAMGYEYMITDQYDETDEPELLEALDDYYENVWSNWEYIDKHQYEEYMDDLC